MSCSETLRFSMHDTVPDVCLQIAEEGQGPLPRVANLKWWTDTICAFMQLEHDNTSVIAVAMYISGNQLRVVIYEGDEVTHEHTFPVDRKERGDEQ